MASVAQTGSSAHLKPSRPLQPHVPRTTKPSTAHEVVSSQTLLAYLDKVAPLETEVDRAHKETTLQELLRVLQEWVCAVAVERGLYPDTDAAKECGGGMFVSGSYKLCINTAESDVDAVFVGPKFITRGDFFEKLPPRLQDFPGVTSMLLISEAYVPLIEMEMRGVSIDLQFVSLPVNTVPRALNILDDDILAGLDEQSARSLNGPRVNELIAMLVPNFDTFKVLARCLRLWAKQRGLYNNKMGFLGGINFAILSAFICQLYPNTSPASLLLAFFNEMSGWAWPRPIFLTKPYTTPLNFEVWNPEIPKYKKDCMPIITPAYPCMNSSYSVKRSTRTVMQAELRRGLEVTKGILSGTDPRAHDWSKLFTPSDFFVKFDLYLVLDISASNAEDMRAWKGWVESRIKTLIDMLENERPPLPLSTIYPFPKGFDRTEIEYVPAEGGAEGGEDALGAGGVAAGVVPAIADVAAGSASEATTSSTTAGSGDSATDSQAPKTSPLAESIASGCVIVSPPASATASSASGSASGVVPPSTSTSFSTSSSAPTTGMATGSSSLADDASASSVAGFASFSSSSSSSAAADVGNGSGPGSGLLSLAKTANVLSVMDESTPGGRHAVEGGGHGPNLAYGGNEVDDSAAEMTFGGRLKTATATSSNSNSGGGVPEVVMATVIGREGDGDGEGNNAEGEGQVSPPPAVDTAAPSAAAASTAVVVAPPTHDSQGRKLIERRRELHSWYVGLMIDRERVKGTTLNLSSVLTMFKRMEILRFLKYKDGMTLTQRKLDWRDLPEEMFAPLTRTRAMEERKGARAQWMQLLRDSGAALGGMGGRGGPGGVGGAGGGQQRSANVWVRPGSGAAAPGAAAAATVAAGASTQPAAALGSAAGPSPLGQAGTQPQQPLPSPGQQQQQQAAFFSLPGLGRVNPFTLVVNAAAAANAANATAGGVGGAAAATGSGAGNAVMLPGLPQSAFAAAAALWQQHQSQQQQPQQWTPEQMEQQKRFLEAAAMAATAAMQQQQQQPPLPAAAVGPGGAPLPPSFFFPQGAQQQQQQQLMGYPRQHGHHQHHQHQQGQHPYYQAQRMALPGLSPSAGGVGSNQQHLSPSVSSVSRGNNNNASNSAPAGNTVGNSGSLDGFNPAWQAHVANANAAAAVNLHPASTPDGDGVSTTGITPFMEQAQLGRTIPPMQMQMQAGATSVSSRNGGNSGSAMQEDSASATSASTTALHAASAAAGAAAAAVSASGKKRPLPDSGFDSHAVAKAMLAANNGHPNGSDGGDAGSLAPAAIGAASIAGAAGETSFEPAFKRLRSPRTHPAPGEEEQPEMAVQQQHMLQQAFNNVAAAATAAPKPALIPASVPGGAPPSTYANVAKGLGGVPPVAPAPAVGAGAGRGGGRGGGPAGRGGRGGKMTISLGGK